LAAEIKTHFGASTELIASHGGVFEVTVDGRRIFSKKALGRFPDDGEIVRLVRSRAS
jgi:selenoprotein W-related protein